MKKITALLLAMLLVLCTGTAALADPVEPETPPKTVATLAKVMTITNEGTTMPAETFTFTIVNAGVTDAADGVDTTNMPKPTIGSVTYEAGGSGPKDIPITLPTNYTSVGVYTYTITENEGNTAGMVYDTTPRTLKVTVVNGDSDGTFKIAGTSLVKEGAIIKSDTFRNTFNARELNITKTVKGNLGNKNQYFAFVVTLSAAMKDGNNLKHAEPFTVSGGSYESNPKEIGLGTPTTFYLKHGETLTISNLPYGVRYSVVETAVEGYTTTSTGNTGTISADTQTAAFINTKESSIDTGITTDSLPYVMLLGIVTMIGAAMFIKRRATSC